MKVARLSWYSHSLLRPPSCWISGLSAGGISVTPHGISEDACAAASSPSARETVSSTGTIVIESTVPRYCDQSQSASGLYSQMIGRFAWSACAHCVSRSSWPGRQPTIDGRPSFDHE